MRAGRQLYLALISIAAITLTGASALLAQGGGRQPPPGGTQPLCVDCGFDLTPPEVILLTPGPFSVEFPFLEIEWCDNVSLNAGSRWILVNGVDRTASFSYTTTANLDCPGARAVSNTSSVALNFGANTIQGHICDNVGNCATETFTVTRTGAGAPTVALRNQNGQNLDRGLCLTVGAGQGAGLSCGDLFVAHGMPAYRTMGRDRSLTLFYSSAAAAPRPVVAVAVTQPSGVQVPSSVFAELKVNGVARASANYYAFGGGTTAQIALAYDASSDATGIYPFAVEVRNIYAGGNYSSTVSGELLVVNRSGSEFGAGWWLAGVEQLVLGQSANRILWLGGDGSAAVYDSVAPARWARAAGEYRDTLVYTPAWKVNPAKYTRTLRHGVQVVFDASGRHTQTISRTGASTTFTWSGSPVRLTSVQVPPGGSGSTYSLAYEGAYQYIDWIQDPAGRRIDPYVGTYLYGTKYAPTYITDPDGYSVNFTYDGIGRMTGRRTRRGYWTTYGHGSVHTSSASVPFSNAPGDTAITTFQWWDEASLAFGIVGGTLTAVDTTSALTKAFGPRRNVADDATFFVDRFGAPTRITDPLGNVTTITRGDPTVPALPTQVQYPDGRIVRMFWDARGNLLQTRDSTSHLGAAGLPTAVARWTYTSANTKDSPDSIIDPEGVITRYAYNSWGLLSEAYASNGHQTSFESVGSGPLTGLVNAVIERQVTVFDSAANSRVVTDLRAAFGFNSLGSVMQDTTAAGRVTTRSRDAYQRVFEVFDPAGVKASLTYNLMNQRTRSAQYIEGGDSLPTTYSYDIDVDTMIADARGVKRRYQYDFADRRVAEIDDYNRADRTWYNLAGAVDSTRSRFFAYTGSGQTVRNYWDNGGRLTRTAWPARELQGADSSLLTYDVMGRTLTAQRVGTSTNPGYTTSRTYYANGALRTETQQGINTAYGYDRAGRRIALRIGTAGNQAQSDSIWYRYSAPSGALAPLCQYE